MSDYLSSVDFENFGPIKKGTLKLTRLHALIGPNDSGKSWTLRGLGGRDPRTSAFIRSVQGGRTISPGHGWPQARTLRLDPDFLRQGAQLIMEGAPLDFSNERGGGLGALLDAVFARNVRDYLALEAEFKQLFPTVDGFRLHTDGSGNRRVGIRLFDGSEVPAEFMSEGMLYFLAFAILPYLSPVGLILVEEPENGLHPSRIAEVMRVLRKISETTQVVLATHSPLVVNELKPEEVTLVTRTKEAGTTFTPITEPPNFKKRSDAYALGELWLNYADGISEAPLFKTNGAQ